MVPSGKHLTAHTKSSFGPFVEPFPSEIVRRSFPLRTSKTRLELSAYPATTILRSWKVILRTLPFLLEVPLSHCAGISNTEQPQSPRKFCICPVVAILVTGIESPHKPIDAAVFTSPQNRFLKPQSS